MPQQERIQDERICAGVPKIPVKYVLFLSCRQTKNNFFIFSVTAGFCDEKSSSNLMLKSKKKLIMTNLQIYIVATFSITKSCFNRKCKNKTKTGVENYGIKTIIYTMFN